MSMIRAQEYFAPLRSRHISLQQWERGLLFESWGSRGGRADRQNSGDLNKYLVTQSDSGEQEIRPVKKVIARSVSFSASVGSEPVVKAKNFARGLSFPRSLASRGEIIPEDSDYCHSSVTTRRSNADLSPMFAAAQQSSTAYLFPRSAVSESGQVEADQISDSSSGQDSEDSSETFSSESCPGADVSLDSLSSSRPLPRKFFSGALSFSRDKKFFSGVLSFSKDKKFFSASLSLPKPCLEPCGRTKLDRSQSWGVNENYVGTSRSSDHHNASNTAASRRSSTETRLKNRFLAKVLSFSRSLDPRGEISSDYGSTLKSHRRTEIRRGLSFSRSLDVNGELLSSDDIDGDEINCGSPNSSSRVPEISWSRRFISRSGLFFSRTLSPKIPREGSSESINISSPVHRHHARSASCSESTKLPEQTTEVRSKKLFGRFSLTLSRFLDPKGEPRGDPKGTDHFSSSSVNSGGGSNGPGGPKVDKLSESHFKRFFTRGFLFSNFKSASDHAAAEHRSSGAGSVSDAGTGFSEGNNYSTKSYSKRFFSKEWSWSRSKSRSPSPAKNSSQTIHSSSRNLSATDETDETTADESNESSSQTDSNTVPSSRHSQALKNWWSKRTSAVSSKSAVANDQNSRLVLLEKVPASDDKDSSDSCLTVYVGERGGSLTKYVLEKQILRHHLFQVLLKCSQDELGTDHDYNSGVPIICDPALFLQVARVVGGNFTEQTTLCR
ncbi:unnamed protein product [Calypogeia fissa]